MDFLQQNWYWAALAAVTGTFLLIDLIRSGGDKSVLSAVEATLLMNREDAVVIDVRDQGEFEAGHIPNARHLALADLSRRMGELEKFKQKPIIVSVPAAAARPARSVPCARPASKSCTTCEAASSSGKRPANR